MDYVSLAKNALALAHTGDCKRSDAAAIAQTQTFLQAIVEGKLVVREIVTEATPS